MSMRHRRLDRKRWANLRLAILNAANWRCALCRAYGSEVDHIKPLESGGDAWAVSNLQAICRDCHVAKTRAERAAKRTPEQRAWDLFVLDLSHGA